MGLLVFLYLLARIEYIDVDFINFDLFFSANLDMMDLKQLLPTWLKLSISSVLVLQWHAYTK